MFDFNSFKTSSVGYFIPAQIAGVDVFEVLISDGVWYLHNLFTTS